MIALSRNIDVEIYKMNRNPHAASDSSSIMSGSQLVWLTQGTGYNIYISFD